MMNLRIKASVFALLSGLATLGVGQTWVTTYHNDIGRTGLNSQEQILKPSNVSPNTFGLLFSLQVDGQVYAQPLYVPNVSIPHKGYHNVVFVCTQHNSVYAFDADNNIGPNAQPLWHVNFGPSVPNREVGSDDINPEIGITSTPAIGPASFGNVNPVLFVVSKTKTWDSNNNPVYTQQLHALDITSGAESLNGPVTIQGSVPGTGDASVNGVVTFNPMIQHARAALLLVPPQNTFSSFAKTKGTSDLALRSGTLYVSFASHGDNGPYHGWIFAYDASTLKLLGIFNTTPNGLTDPTGYPIAAGGIWQGGAGPASDGKNIYFSTGNGKFDPATGSYGDSILRIQNRQFSVADWFAPANQLNLDDYDADLGSGGVMLLPTSAGNSKTPGLMVHSGKEGTIYLLDKTNLGGYGSSDKIVQELPYVMGGIWGAPAYYNGAVYYGPCYSGLVAFPIKNGQFTSTSPVSSSNAYFGYPGPTPSISSYGNTNGIVWAIQTDGYGNGSPAVLHAFDASNLQVELYNSAINGGRDSLGGAVKFAVPTIVGGKVYAGSDHAVGVFGLGKWVATPVVSPPSGTYQTNIQVTVTDSTPNSTIYYTLDGSIPTQASSKYTGPVTVSSSCAFKVRAFAPSLVGSAIVENDYLVNPVIGNGTGLLGNYFANSKDGGGIPTASEIDSLINFNWNGGSPINGVDGSNWAGEWTGQVQAMTTGTYTFYTNSDDGVRVWINGQLVIDDFSYHAPTMDQGTIKLVAGQKYSIDIKYFQGGGGSVLQLFWSAPGFGQQLVPTSQLYPGSN